MWFIVQVPLCVVHCTGLSAVHHTGLFVWFTVQVCVYGSLHRSLCLWFTVYVCVCSLPYRSVGMVHCFCAWVIVQASVCSLFIIIGSESDSPSRERVWFTVPVRVCGSLYKSACMVYSTSLRVWFTLQDCVCGSLYISVCMVHCTGLCVTCCKPFASYQLAQDLGEFICLCCCVPNWLVPVRTKVRTQLGIEVTISFSHPMSICLGLCVSAF